MSDRLAMSHEDAIAWIEFGFRQASGITTLQGRLRAQEAANEALRSEIREILRDQKKERLRVVVSLLEIAQHWNIYAAANQEDPEKVAAGLAVDQVCRELAKEIRAWTERPEPMPGEPTSGPESE